MAGETAFTVTLQCCGFSFSAGLRAGATGLPVSYALGCHLHWGPPPFVTWISLIFVSVLHGEVLEHAALNDSLSSKEDIQKVPKMNIMKE